MNQFTPNPAGLGEVMRGPDMQAGMRAAAEKVADAARAVAPVGRAAGDTTPGRYKAGFEVSSGVREGRSGRAYGRVENRTPYAAAVEWGNGRTSGKTIDAHYVLTRAIDVLRE